MNIRLVSRIQIHEAGLSLLALLMFGFSGAQGQGVADADFLPPPAPIQEPERVQLAVPVTWTGLPVAGARSSVYSAAEEVINACRSKALNPDPNGIIWISYGKSEAEPVFQNPFDARLALRRALVETLVRFSGVVNGPNPVAIVNGKALVQGDRWMGFNIAAIARNVVLLEKNGAYVSVPRGREVTIRETY